VLRRKNPSLGKKEKNNHSKTIALLKLFDSGIEILEIVTIEQCFSFMSF